MIWFSMDQRQPLIRITQDSNVANSQLVSHKIVKAGQLLTCIFKGSAWILVRHGFLIYSFESISASAGRTTLARSTGNSGPLKMDFCLI